MKKIITFLIVFLSLLIPSVSFAAIPIVFPANGGSGWGMPGGITVGDLLIGNGLSPYATSTNLTFNTTNNVFTTLNASTTILSSLSSSYFATGGGRVGIGATSTPGSLLSIQGIANLTTATSTFYGNGLNLSNGCFSINNVCVGSGSTGTVTSVSQTVPAFLSISGSPVTTSGTLAISLSGTALPAINGGTGLTSYSQGDLIYGSAANTLSQLPKNTTATRYLANTGTSNNPAWDQINLANGVTGTLPVANGGTASTSLSGILIGNNAGTVNTLTIGSGLTLSGTTLSASAGSSLSSATTSAQQLSTTTISFTSTGITRLDFSFHASSTNGTNFNPKLFINAFNGSDSYSVNGNEMAPNATAANVIMDDSSSGTGYATLTVGGVTSGNTAEIIATGTILNLVGNWIYIRMSFLVPQQNLEDEVFIKLKKATAGPITSISFATGRTDTTFATSTVMTVNGY